MNVDVPAFTDDARRAALLVHALPPEDQAWLLAALPSPQRDVVQSLLIELLELEIPVDEGLLQEVLARPVAPAAAVAADPLAALAACDARQLARLFESEAPALIARLLVLRPWPWKAALLTRLRPQLAREVVNAKPLPRAPALDEAICAALLRRLADGTDARCRPLGWRAALGRLVPPRRPA